MQDQLAARFEADRAHLRSVAYRMLGSPTEADDAVQEAWLRLSRSDTSEVDNLTGWLTTVVARVSLGMLQARGHLSYWTRWRRLSGWRSSCTTCSACRLTRSRPLWIARLRRRGSWLRGRGGGFVGWSRPGMCSGGARLFGLSWPLPGKGISRRWLLCLIRGWWPRLMTRLLLWGRFGMFGGLRRWRGCSVDGLRGLGLLCWTGCLGLCGRRARCGGWRFGSPSWMGWWLALR